jgi:hypothetical protein
MSSQLFATALRFGSNQCALAGTSGLAVGGAIELGQVAPAAYRLLGLEFEIT